MFSLSNDLLLEIIFNLPETYDVINFSRINKITYETFDNSFYIYWGRNKYSREFWSKANNRTPIMSKPLINMKMELLRIDNFQKYQIEQGYQLWTNEDFYVYCNSVEKLIYRETPLNWWKYINSTNHSRLNIQFINNELDRVLSIL